METGDLGAPSSVLCFFKVNWTLPTPQQKITKERDGFLQQLREKIKVGMLGRQDFEKVQEQLGNDRIEEQDYVFFQKMAWQHTKWEPLCRQNIQDQRGETINYRLSCISETELPKRGYFHCSSKQDIKCNSKWNVSFGDTNFGCQISLKDPSLYQTWQGFPKVLFTLVSQGSLIINKNGDTLYFFENLLIKISTQALAQTLTLGVGATVM